MGTPDEDTIDNLSDEIDELKKENARLRDIPNAIDQYIVSHKINKPVNDFDDYERGMNDMLNGMDSVLRHAKKAGRDEKANIELERIGEEVAKKLQKFREQEEKIAALEKELKDFRDGNYNGAKVIREEIRMLGVVQKENARLRAHLIWLDDFIVNEGVLIHLCGKEGSEEEYTEEDCAKCKYERAKKALEARK